MSSFGKILSGPFDLIAGMSAEDSRRKALRGTRADVRELRDLQEQAYREARGGTGFAQLPFYAKDASGQPIEPQLFQRALQTYQAATTRTPEQQLADYRNAVSQYDALRRMAIGDVTGIFTGQTLQGELAAQAPVFEARTQLAKGRGASALEKATEDANAALAIQASRRGFTGTSSFEQRPLQEMRRQGLQQQATELGQAKLANVSDEARTRLADIARRIGNVNLPFQLAEQELAYRRLPEFQANQANLEALNAFRPFTIGVGAPRQIAAYPGRQPTASDLQVGADVTAGVLGSIGSDIGALAGFGIGQGQGVGGIGGLLGGSAQQNSYTQPGLSYQYPINPYLYPVPPRYQQQS